MTREMITYEEHLRRTAPMPKDEARALTDRIRAGITELAPLIIAAYEGRADVALGYNSWPAYCKAEGVPLKLPVADRQEAIRQLEPLMSAEAVAAALGVSHQTVRN